MHTYEDWRRHYELPDTDETRMNYREYLEALEILQAVSQREDRGVSTAARSHLKAS